MLIDTSNLEKLDVTPRVVSGVSPKDDGVLRQNMLVVVAKGVNSYLDYVEQHYKEARQSKSSSDNGRSFHSFDSYEETLDTFRNNPKSLVKFNPVELSPKEYTETGNDVEYDVTGDFIDMGRYIEGIPEVMGSMHNGKARTRRVRILVDNGHAAFTAASAILHRSERIIRLIDALESANVRTELIVVDSTGCAHMEITVKNFDEPLLLEDVAVATHTDFFRRIGFRVMEWSDTWRGGYGRCDWFQNHLNQFQSALNDEITIYVGNSPERIDDGFDKLEKMLVDELSEPQPLNNLFLVDENDCIAKQMTS